MKAVIVLVLLAVLFFAVEARRKCVESANVECKYERKCVALRNVCKRHETVRHRCAAFGKKWTTGFKKQKVCVKWNRSVRAKGGRCQRCAKTAIRHKKVRVQKAFCKRYHTKRVCRQWTRECKRHRAVKRCWVVEHLFNLRGPKRCRAGKHLAFKKVGRTIRRRCVKGNAPAANVVCNSYLDPHTTAAGRNFEFQYSGDRVMAESADGIFAVHQRLKSFGTFTGTIGMAVRANGRDVVEYLGKNRLLLNGKPINTQGTTELPEGGSVRIAQVGAQTHVEVFATNGARALLVEFSGTYANLVVYTPASVTLSGGYCTGANIQKWAGLTASGLFQYRRKVRFLSTAQKRANAKRRKPTKQQRKNANIRCKAAGLKGVTRRNCVKDVLAMRGTGKTGGIIKIFKDIKREVRAGKRARRPHPRRQRRNRRAAAAGGRRKRRGGWLRRVLRRL